MKTRESGGEKVAFAPTGLEGAKQNPAGRQGPAGLPVDPPTADQQIGVTMGQLEAAGPAEATGSVGDAIQAGFEAALTAAMELSEDELAQATSAMQASGVKRMDSG